MDLTGFPAFTVTAIHLTEGDPDATIVGRLSSLDGVQNLGGTLYRPSGRSIIGAVNAPIRALENFDFVTPDVERLDDLSRGQTLPWVDYAWNAYHVDLVLYGEWFPREFIATPAERFKVGNVTGWQPLGMSLPEGAVSLGINEGAWDHEHCLICNTHIGAGGDFHAYSAAADHWVCRSCNAKYVVPRDISFLLEA